MEQNENGAGLGVVFFSARRSRSVYTFSEGVMLISHAAGMAQEKGEEKLP